jgi:hypothetical protein
MASLKDLPKIDRIIRGDDGPEFVVLPYAKYKKFVAGLSLEGEIDEAAYLKANPDVAKAIREKRLASGKDHYLTAGYIEGRRARIVR